MIKIKRILFILLSILIYFFLFSKTYAYTFVLDAGHGASDPGAVNGSFIESEINHKIANYLKEYLEQYKDVKVLMTNTGQNEVTLFERAMVGRDNKADLIVSLHINSSFDSSANGAEVYVTANKTCDKYNKKCTELANKILANLGKLGIANRGVKTKLCSDETDVYSDGTRADWMGIIRYAMRGTGIDDGEIFIIKNGVRIPATEEQCAIVEKGEGIPSILVEHCFINGKDVAYLDTDAKIKKLAEADGKAIVEQYSLKLKDATPTPTATPTVTPKPTATPTATAKPTATPAKVDIKVDDTKKTVTIVPSQEAKNLKEYFKGKQVKILDSNGKETETLATGGKIQVGDITYSIIKLGDATGDGKVNSKDAIKILKYYVDLEKIEGNYLKASDVTGDDKVNSKDAIKILKYFVDLETITL